MARRANAIKLSMFSPILLTAVLGWVSPLSAQQVKKQIQPLCPGCGGGDSIPPTVYMPSGGYFRDSTVSVAIYYSDNSYLETPSITLNGGSSGISMGVSFTGQDSAEASGTVTLPEGRNTLATEACDASNNCTTASAYYWYDNQAPTISISPGDTLTNGSSLSVTITWGDNLDLNASSRWIELNGSVVTSSFGYSGGALSGTSTGTVTLSSGTDTLSAHICDEAGNCSTSSVTYTYDTQAPTISISPGNTLTDSSALSVTVTWGDNVGLDASTRTITFNNNADTSSFNWSVNGNGTSATSTGTVTLTPGTNTLYAHICDEAGNCTTSSSVTYTYDNGGPTISISPGTETVPDTQTSLSPTITWSDNNGLNASTRTITFNGSVVTSSFSYSGNGTSATSTGTVTLDPGTNTLYAHVCDNAGNCTTSPTVTYTRSQTSTVTVTASVAVDTIVAGTSDTLAFTVENGGNSSTTYSLSATCTGDGATGTCTRSPSSVQLNASAQGTADVVFGTSGTGDSLWVKLEASGGGATGADSVLVTLTHPGGMPNVPVLTTHPVKDVLDRGSCLTISLGQAAASNCGDLRMAHALPAMRSMNKTFAPELLYSASAASSAPVVLPVDVMLLDSSAASDSMEAVLSINGSAATTRTWSGSRWTPGTSLRIVALGTTDSTGVFADSLAVTNFSSDGTSYVTAQKDTLIHVSRAGSAFGDGWWLAGLEQLKDVGGAQMLWIGGDGSARIYDREASDTVWQGVNRTRPDSIVREGAYYVRVVPGGVQVRFDTLSGRQVSTVDLSGDTTAFSYDGSGRLTTITLPAASGSSRPYYQFSYDANGELDEVQAYGYGGSDVRTVQVRVSSAQLDSITDPDGTVTQFQYTDTSVSREVLGGGTKSVFLFDDAGQVRAVHNYVDATEYFTTMLRAQKSEGVDDSGSYAPASPSALFTQLDGPRTDVGDTTEFYLDSYGEPDSIKDAMGSVTRVTRGDLNWPGLVTQTEDPNGRIVTESYDALGRPDSVIDYADTATTTYQWSSSCPDFPSKITKPEGDFVQYGYNSWCGRTYQQDARGSSSRVKYLYTNHQLTWVRPPLADTIHVMYRTTRSGNLYRVLRYNSGTVDTTNYTQDAWGDNKVITTQVDSATTRTKRIWYDAMGRDTLTRVSASSESVYVGKTYGQGGLLLSESTWTDPDPSGIGTVTHTYSYDRLGRDTLSVGAGDTVHSTYDPAGNVVSKKTRDGAVLTMTYDRMNRLSRRIVPAVTYAADSTTGLLVALDLTGDGYSGRHPYPWYPNDGSGLKIDADTATFDYDAGGRLVTADNRDARARRTYFLNGQIETDSLWIRDYEGNSFDHVYGLRYEYDLDGRLRVLHHPAQLATGAGMRDSVVYVYSDTTGDLTQITTLLGHSVSFGYDTQDRLVRKSLPGGIVDSLTYDGFGRLTLDRVANGSSSPYKDSEPFLRYTTLQYAVDRALVSAALNTHGWKDTVNASYSGLGYLDSLRYRRPANVSDTALYVPLGGDLVDQRFSFDPLGNGYSSYVAKSGSLGYGSSFSGGSNGGSYFQAGTGRVDSTFDAGGMHRFVYDAAGNTRSFYQSSVAGNTLNDRVSWYGAANRLRFAEWREAFNNGNWTNPGWQDVFEEYRYDALGRRILVMSRRNCVMSTGDTTAFANCQVGRVRRTVWDGSRELWEIQMPAPVLDSTFIENDTAAVALPGDTDYNGNYADPNPLFGRVAYTYGGGIDQPVSLTRIHLARHEANESVTEWNPVELEPLWNWRGEADVGTFGDGGMKTCTSAGHCVFVQWRGVAFATGLASELLWTQPYGWSPYGWFGTLIDNKEDGTQTFFRRNRYVDPMTGRFTQTDPIGIAGGLNLYGYAGSDPVTFTDPFGLSSDCRIVKCPSTPAELARDPRLKKFADQLWQMSVKAGFKQEYGAHIVVDSKGNWKMVDVTAGNQGSIPDMPKAPDNAVAEIHTHPGVVYPSGGRSEGQPQPSAADAERVNRWWIYGVVIAPRDYGIIPVAQYTWYDFPRGGKQ